MWWKFSETIYHGTKTKPGLGQISGYYPGVYTSLDKNLAQSFGDNLYSTKVDINKIYHVKNEDMLKKEAQQNGFGYHSGNGQNEVEYLKSLGFIGLKRGNEIILFNNFDPKFEIVLK